jgi:predicted nuclease with RNAse H fold
VPLATGLQGKNGDRNLAQALVDGRPTATALDAPLHLPHAVQCETKDCERCFPDHGEPASYSTRELERVGGWRDLSATMRGPMPMVMVAGIAFRAIYLARVLDRQGISVIETWPMGVYRALEKRAGDQTAKSLDADARRSLLETAVEGLSTLPADVSTDQLDAIAAAYAAWAYATGQALSIPHNPGDEGAIWMPNPGKATAT